MSTSKCWLLGWWYPRGRNVHQQRHRPSGVDSYERFKDDNLVRQKRFFCIRLISDAHIKIVIKQNIYIYLYIGLFLIVKASCIKTKICIPLWYSSCRWLWYSNNWSSSLPLDSLYRFNCSRFQNLLLYRFNLLLMKFLITKFFNPHATIFILSIMQINFFIKKHFLYNNILKQLMSLIWNFQLHA